ncbi:hypothetical protein VNO77_18848 [Canavalia gladiata]|uniref:Uncharacterized protein n=1 Tax=Canavalia gladiata TaxID=3824 RepID=A0AAN9LQ02_CANGL
MGRRAFGSRPPTPSKIENCSPSSSTPIWGLKKYRLTTPLRYLSGLKSDPYFLSPQKSNRKSDLNCISS